ncbi:hypothetical protein E4U42_000669 [Claviceps africana]|uniref:Uncharacterized protein n=1 Tax=Claviceps africana TaxID=83212 RepID=A0A8K0IZW3_9HYPO|nr:hypothetical protein E4U42_000669 [Claviceps africana]
MSQQVTPPSNDTWRNTNNATASTQSSRRMFLFKTLGSAKGREAASYRREAPTQSRHCPMTMTQRWSLGLAREVAIEPSRQCDQL